MQVLDVALRLLHRPRVARRVPRRQRACQITHAWSTDVTTTKDALIIIMCLLKEKLLDYDVNRHDCVCVWRMDVNSATRALTVVAVSHVGSHAVVRVVVRRPECCQHIELVGPIRKGFLQDNAQVLLIVPGTLHTVHVGPAICDVRKNAIAT